MIFAPLSHAARVCGFGHAVPVRSLANEEISRRADITDEWIVSRTGIRERRILAEGQTGTDLALASAQMSLADAGLTPADVTHIIYATCTPDSCCPSAACTLAHKLGVTDRMAVDLNAACAGFVNGLELARCIAVAEGDACVLLVASESLSHRCNWEDHGTAVLFGDGAGSVLVLGKNRPASASLSGGIVGAKIGVDGSRGELLLISGGFSATPYTLGSVVGPEYFIRMEGGLVFKHAVRSMTRCCKELLEANGLAPEDVDLFIPHQANQRIIEAVGERLAVPLERVFLNVHKYGNTSAASIPLALSEAAAQGAVRPGMTVLMTTFGGGLTYGAALLRF